MEGIWKVSFALRRLEGRVELPTIAKIVPTRLRFSGPPGRGGPGLIKVPMLAGSTGSWQLAPGPADASGAQSARFVVECSGMLLLFDGLYDGERIAGTVHDETEPLCAVSHASLLLREREPSSGVLGDFICIRLFSLWGTPKPKAGHAGG